MFFFLGPVEGLAGVDKAIDAAVVAQAGSSKTQKSIDKVSDETAVLLESYRATMAQIDALRSYNEQLESLLQSQATEADALQAQIDGIATTAEKWFP